MKFTKQRTKYDCSVVAICNASTWSGHQVNYSKHKKLLIKNFKLKENKGLAINVFNAFIKGTKLPFKIVKIKKNVSIKELKKYIDNNSIVILGIDYKGYAHVGLVIKLNKKTAEMVNWGGKKAIRRVPLSKLRKLMSQWNIAYFIKRENK